MKGGERMISVIIPAYNVEKYIGECIESVINQTYTDIEIIIVNDGSTDNTEKEIKKYASLYNNIKYFYQDNKGVSEARNLGITMAVGEYIYFIDPDDYIEKEALELMYNKIYNMKADVVICGYKAFYEDNSREDEYNIYKVDDNKIYSNIYCIEEMLSLKIKGYVWDKLFKRENLVKNKFSFEAGRYIQDWFPVFKEIYNSSRVVFVNKPLYNYRLRNGSTIHKRNEKLIDDYYYAVNNILNFLKKGPIKINEKKISLFKINTFYTLILGYYLYYIRDNNLNKKRNVYKSFLSSKYGNYKVSLNELIFCSKISRVQLKVLLWKMRIFHLIYKCK